MEHDAIVATVMDYFEGWFDGNADRMKRALHPALNKRSIRFESQGPVLSNPSSAQQMIGWTEQGEGQAVKPADPAIKVRVDDVYDHIATATVYSAIYVEYLHLMKTPEGWRIVNALYMNRQ
jgi:Putative lumazine-binding